MNTPEIRRQAQSAIQGKYSKACITFLIYSVFITIVNFIPIIGQIFSLIISIPLSYSLTYSMIKIKRNEDFEYSDFITIAFSQFSNSWKVGFSILGKLWPYILGFMGSFVFITIISITTYITNAYTFAGNEPEINNLEFTLILYILAFIVCIVSYIFLLLKSLYYSLSYYILYDNPTATGKEIVERSNNLMTGHRWDFIKLQIPYYLILLGISFILSFFIAIMELISDSSIFSLFSIVPQIFIMPLVQFAIICFYDKLIGNSDNPNNYNDSYFDDNNIIINPEQSINHKYNNESKKGFSITSLVLGIVSILLFCIYPLSLICAVLAIIFGAIGIHRGGKGMGITGIITGILGIVLVFTLFIGVFSLNKNIIDKSKESVNNYQNSYNKSSGPFDNNAYPSTKNSLTLKGTTIKYAVPSNYNLSDTYTYSTSTTNYYNTTDYSISVNCSLTSHNSQTAKEYLEKQIQWNNSYKNSKIQSIGINGNNIYYVVSKSGNTKRIEAAYVLPNNYLYKVSASCYSDDAILTINTISDFLKINY